ncbi:MAG TPA: hypothetical protein VG013_12655 [Gemmataceae bacterium]|nr:hypothetical protein [Gemmataceae bacterium]
MSRTGGWRWVGKACLGVAAGGVCLGPAAAQSPSSAATARTEAQHPQPPAVKEVTLSVDGTFRVAVVTRSGYYVPGARVTISRSHVEGPGHIALAGATSGGPESLNLITGAAGPTAVVGVKPGVYQVRVEGRQKASETTLVVKASPLTPGPIVQTQVLLPSPDSPETDPAVDAAGGGAAGGGSGGGFGLGEAAALGVLGGIPALGVGQVLAQPKTVTSP